MYRYGAAAEGYLKELLLEKGRTSKKAATTACGGCGGTLQPESSQFTRSLNPP